jgi:GDPmannose 4,6-dehydratase
VGQKQQKLYLGNLEARRDWGYAPEYVEAMWSMLQQDLPDDYVIGTGETHSVQEFLVEAFTYAGLDWQDYVEIDARYFRPLEIDVLIADPSKARRQLSWKPRVSFQDLVRIMVDADLERAGSPVPGAGRRLVRERFGNWYTEKSHVNTAVLRAIASHPE